MNCMCRSPSICHELHVQESFLIAGVYQQIEELYRIPCKKVLYTKKSKMEAYL